MRSRAPAVDGFAREDLIAFGRIPEREGHQRALARRLRELEVVDLGQHLHLAERAVQHQKVQRQRARRLRLQCQLQKKTMQPEINNRDPNHDI